MFKQFVLLNYYGVDGFSCYIIFRVCMVSYSSLLCECILGLGYWFRFRFEL